MVQKNQVQVLLCIIVVFLACKSEPNIAFFAIKESEIYKFENSISVNEFINKAESFKCEGYNIVAKSKSTLDTTQFDFVIKTNCKYSEDMSIVHPDGIELPVYKCHGFRKYGINLCQDENSNFELIKEFYLNPNQRADYPTKPKNATVTFVVDESCKIYSVIPMINKIKKMRNKIGDTRLMGEPFLLRMRTAKEDSILYKPPKTVN